MKRLFVPIVSGLFTISVVALGAPDAFAQRDGAQQTQAQQQNAGQRDQVTIGGQHVRVSDLIGKRVITPRGDSLGTVVDRRAVEEAPNDFIVRLEDENTRMGIAAGQQSEEAGGEPTVVGGRTVAVPAEALTYDRSRDVIILDMNAVTTLENFRFPFEEVGVED